MFKHESGCLSTKPLHWWVWFANILETAVSEYCRFWGTSMTKLKTLPSTEYWLHASASPSWGRFASADNLLSCFPAARPHSTAPRRFITSHHFFLRLRKNLDDTNLASLNKSHSMIMKTYPQFHRLSLELLSLQYFYYSIVAIPSSTLGSWVDWTCRICRTASNWVCVCLGLGGPKVQDPGQCHGNQGTMH